MPHQSPDSTKATAQNTATGHEPATERKPGIGRRSDPEPRSYAAHKAQDATLAPPAAGEVDDYMDEGEPSYGAHQGATNTNRPLHAGDPGGKQGRKTRAANKDIFSNRR